MFQRSKFHKTHVGCYFKLRNQNMLIERYIVIVFINTLNEFPQNVL